MSPVQTQNQTLDGLLITKLLRLIILQKSEDNESIVFSSTVRDNDFPPDDFLVALESICLNDKNNTLSIPQDVQTLSNSSKLDHISNENTFNTGK